MKKPNSEVTNHIGGFSVYAILNSLRSHPPGGKFLFLLYSLLMAVVSALGESIISYLYNTFCINPVINSMSRFSFIKMEKHRTVKILAAMEI